MLYGFILQTSHTHSSIDNYYGKSWQDKSHYIKYVRSLGVRIYHAVGAVFQSLAMGGA